MRSSLIKFVGMFAAAAPALGLGITGAVSTGSATPTLAGSKNPTSVPADSKGPAIAQSLPVCS